MEPEYRARLAKQVSRFQELRTKGLATDSLTETAVAVAQGRVETLVVEAERKVPGRLDSETGTISAGELNDPAVDDLLDDLAELALLRGGNVIVTPASDAPTTTGVAAIFRF